MTRSNDDCYFYYYSTCAKGNACTFRHCADALGNETVCPLWQEDRCFSQNCKLRHAEIVKDRKRIPCYWESQPGGCKKEHCVFMHNKPKTSLQVVQARLPNSLSAEASELVSTKRSGSQADVIKENAAPSPKVNPVLITVDHDDENSNSDKVASPTKSFSPIVVTGPKTIRTKKSLGEKVDEPNQLNFGVKSLEQIRKEKEERLRPACASADGSAGAAGCAPAAGSSSSPNASADAPNRARSSEPGLPGSPAKPQRRGAVKAAAAAAAVAARTHDGQELALAKSKKSVAAVTAARVDGPSGSQSSQRSPVKLTTNQVAVRPLPKKDHDITEVRIKTFAEIMEEKRKRKENQLASTEGTANNSKGPEVAAGSAVVSSTAASTLAAAPLPSSRQSGRSAASAESNNGFTTQDAASRTPAKPPFAAAERDLGVVAAGAAAATSTPAAAAAANEDVCRRGGSAATVRPTASVAPLGGEPRVDAEQRTDQRASKRKPSASCESAADGVVVDDDVVGSTAKRRRSAEPTTATGAVTVESGARGGDEAAAPVGGGGAELLLLGLDDDDKELDELLRSDDGDAVSRAPRSSASVTSVNDDDLMREMAVLLQ